MAPFLATATWYLLFFLGNDEPHFFQKRLSHPRFAHYEDQGVAVSSAKNETAIIYKLLSLAGNNFGSVSDYITSNSSVGLRHVDVKPLKETGFCNAVYEVKDIGIVKLFSPIAQARMRNSGFQVGEIDSRFAKHNLGPKTLAATNQGILMERLPSSCALTETHIHSSDTKATMKAVARALANVHSLSIREHHDNESTISCPNMLWHTIDVMLSMIPAEIATFYKDEVKKHKEILKSLDLPTVLGHGDFKPSNVMVVEGFAKFLDLETAGRHYRAYDLAKFFRTDRKTAFTDSNQREFLAAYLENCSINKNDDGIETSLSLRLEADVLVPMTWLEAAIFFECSAYMDNPRYDKWKELAAIRVKHYRKSLSLHDANLKSLMNALKRQ